MHTGIILFFSILSLFVITSIILSLKLINYILNIEKKMIEMELKSKILEEKLKLNSKNLKPKNKKYTEKCLYYQQEQ